MAEKFLPTAKVIDGILILSLPDALSPVVWQMELGQSKSSALEIRDSEDGKFLLTLKTPRHDVLDIATYSNRDMAIKALLVVSQALEKAHGQLKAGIVSNGYSSPAYPVPAVSSYNVPNQFWSVTKKILKAISIFFLVLIVLGFAILLVGKFLQSNSSGGTSPSETAPISADEFLENR